jgi:uncharacterized protein (DUF427 family)
MAEIEKIKPGPGQESVWDYPRPPIVELSKKPVRVLLNGIVVAEADSTLRVLETSHPPVHYIHPDNINWEYIRKATKTTFCEYKGLAAHYTVEVSDLKVVNGAWYYPAPTSGYLEIKGYVAFYPGKFECYINGERAKAQHGDFYGGWITSDVVGPFKGEPGTLHW